MASTFKLFFTGRYVFRNHSHNFWISGYDKRTGMCMCIRFSVCVRVSVCERVYIYNFPNVSLKCKIQVYYISSLIPLGQAGYNLGIYLIPK